MGRRPILNPKNKILNFKVTEEDYLKYKSLGLKGDEGIRILINKYGGEQKLLEIEKYRVIQNIKEVDELIEELEQEKFNLENKLEELNKEMGYVDINGKNYSVDVFNSVNMITAKYHRISDSFDIIDFFEKEKMLIETQAYLVNLSVDELQDLVIENIQ